MKFGELQNVTLRDVWSHEAIDFTPWLSENMDRLSEAIGIPLELEGTEVAVERFSADIVARNPIDNSRILIENQLEDSDHTHLGQILTYLAGMEAQTVIWIAREFDESHRSAVRWLNDHTLETFAFFAVRVRVVKIADSPLVPLFEVLERPSGWDRSVRRNAGARSDLSRFRRDFWAWYAARHPDGGVSAGHEASSFWIWIPSAELYLSVYVALDAVGVSVRGRRGESPAAVRDRIQAREPELRTQLDVEIGEGTSWGSFAKSRRAFDTQERGNWPAMADWLHDKSAAYRRVLEASPAPPGSAAAASG